MNSKTTHAINKINALNNVNKKYEKDEYKNKLFKSIKIVKPKIDIKAEVSKKKSLYDKEDKEYIDGVKKRINYPYKGIIKKFDYEKKIQDKKDLIVFRPEEEDKNVEKFLERIDNFKNETKKHNEELKQVYTENTKDEYIKKFEYNNKYKYVVENVDNDDVGDNLRKERIEHYENQKEKNYNNNVSIIDDLLKDGIINQDLTNIDFDKIDADALEKKLIEKFGREKYLEMMNEL